MDTIPWGQAADDKVPGTPRVPPKFDPGGACRSPGPAGFPRRLLGDSRFERAQRLFGDCQWGDPAHSVSHDLAESSRGCHLEAVGQCRRRPVDQFERQYVRTVGIRKSLVELSGGAVGGGVYLAFAWLMRIPEGPTIIRLVRSALQRGSPA